MGCRIWIPTFAGGDAFCLILLAREQLISHARYTKDSSTCRLGQLLRALTGKGVGSEEQEEFDEIMEEEDPESGGGEEDEDEDGFGGVSYAAARFSSSPTLPPHDWVIVTPLEHSFQHRSVRSDWIKCVDYVKYRICLIVFYVLD